MHRLFRNGLFLCCDPDRRVHTGDMRVKDGRIEEFGVALEAGDAEIHDLSGRWVVPGFVQGHVHLCQTLFRGLAEDLPLLAWLSERVWPLEAALDEESTYWSARLGVTELLLGGSTCALDMGSLRHVGAVFQACEEAGVRVTSGRALMDLDNPAGLSMETEANLNGASDEADRWHNRGRLRYAFSPRFVPSCSEGLLREVAQEARRRGSLIHSHASEHAEEARVVRERTGRDNVQYLHDLGLSGPDTCLAHCVQLSATEMALLAETGTRVLHCPSANMKLGSGIAPVVELLEAGVTVALGADGAPCNNRLDMFTEMRQAGLLQKVRRGAEALPAVEILQMATLEGARALGLEAVCGSLEVGKRADMVVIDPDAPGLFPSTTPAAAIVYSATSGAVSEVWLDGDCVVRQGVVLAWDHQETLTGARRAQSALEAGLE